MKLSYRLTAVRHCEDRVAVLLHSVRVDQQNSHPYCKGSRRPPSAPWPLRTSIQRANGPHAWPSWAAPKAPCLIPRRSQHGRELQLRELCTAPQMEPSRPDATASHHDYFILTILARQNASHLNYVSASAQGATYYPEPRCRTGLRPHTPTRTRTGPRCAPSASTCRRRCCVLHAHRVPRPTTHNESSKAVRLRCQRTIHIRPNRRTVHSAVLEGFQPNLFTLPTRCIPARPPRSLVFIGNQPYP